MERIMEEALEAALGQVREQGVFSTEYTRTLEAIAAKYRQPYEAVAALSRIMMAGFGNKPERAQRVPGIIAEEVNRGTITLEALEDFRDQGELLYDMFRLANAAGLHRSDQQVGPLMERASDQEFIIEEAKRMMDLTMRAYYAYRA